MKTASDVAPRVRGARTPAEGRRAAAQRSSDPDASTRQRVAQSILEHGPSTAAALAQSLGLTAAAVRRHLDVLLERGHLLAREQRVYGTRGRGRPAKVFALTDAGRAAFYSAYDEIAISALEFLSDQVGPDAVGRFARAQAEAAGQRYGESMAAAGPELTPAAALAGALSSDGYVASVHPSALGEQLCQHHCPVAHVAEKFPQLCEVETDLFSKLLGVHVQRLATIAHGDGVCTTHIPRPVREVTPSPGPRAAVRPNNSRTEDAVLNDAGPATESQPTTPNRTTLREPLS